MKKALTIGGIIGFLLISALAISIFFPGLPTYLKVKHKYEHIDELVTEFEAISPAFAKTFTKNSVTIKTPDGWVEKETGRGIIDPTNNYTMLISHDNYIEDNYSGYDPWQGYNYKEEDYKHFFDSIGVKTNQYDLADNMVWYIRDSFTSKDCLKLRGMDRKVFEELAESKETAYQEEKMWKIKNGGYTGYVGQVFAYGYEGNMWTFTFFPVDDEVNKYSIMMKCSDEKTAKQIISSIELEQ